MADLPAPIDLLLAHLPPAAHHRLEQSPHLLAELAAKIVAAPAAWPGVAVTPKRFISYLAGHLPQEVHLERAWSNWNVEELYLCCALAAGEAPALTVFEARFHPIIRATLRRMRLSDTLQEDLEQQLREQLLVGSGREPPLISHFGGLGHLSGWLKVVTARIARRQLQKEKQLIPLGDERIADGLLEHEQSPSTSPAHKQAFREAFHRAVRQALGELEPRQINLVRHRYVDELGLERIAAIYRVHHTTVLRWLEKIREALLLRTQELLGNELQVDTAECASIIRTLQSQFDMTLLTLMGKPRRKDKE